MRCYSNGNSVGDMLASDDKVLKVGGFRRRRRESTKFDESTVDDVRLLVFASLTRPAA